MDEPFAALDEARRKEAIGLIERVRDEFPASIVYVSHQTEEVLRLAAKVAILREGALVATGAPEDVFLHARSSREAGRFDLVSQLNCRVGAYDARYGLTRCDHPAGPVFIAGKFDPPGKSLSLNVRAVDVALSRTPPQGLSIRTALKARVASIEVDDGPLAVVLLELQGRQDTQDAAVADRLFVSLTRMAADALELRQDAEVFALVKAVALNEGVS